MSIIYSRKVSLYCTRMLCVVTLTLSNSYDVGKCVSFRRGRLGLRPGPVPYGPELLELVSFYEWEQFGPLAEMYSVLLEYPEVRDSPLPNYGEDYVSHFHRPGITLFIT